MTTLDPVILGFVQRYLWMNMVADIMYGTEDSEARRNCIKELNEKWLKENEDSN